ncbi:MAG TPA: hypothetical protein VEW69_02105 [Alphaproteobacteria bacterium]|nr:hypothetical protein [Alphaproteobacteria bacterium]
MTLVTKTTVTNLRYAIEPKPEGGFVARSADPSMPSVEGGTRDEVQQKIEAIFSNLIQQKLPQFKLGMNLTINNKTTFTSSADGAEASQALAELKQKFESGALAPGMRADQLFDELHKVDPSIPAMGIIMRVIRYAISAALPLLAWYYLTHR